MHPAGFAEADRTAQRRGTGQMHFARLQDDRFVERAMLVAVALADENAQQRGFVWNFHASYRLRVAAQRWPAQTAPRQRTTARITVDAARNQSPFTVRFTVWRLKEGNKE